jgi:type I restriction enzyme S subunit
VSNQLERERIARCVPSWPVFRLKRLARLKGGGTPSKENESFWTDGEIPWVSPKDMKRRVITETEDYITPDAVDGSATSFVETGSPLIVVRSGILRHTLPVAIAGRRVTLNQDMKAFTLRNNVDATFFAFWIEGQSSELLLEWRQFGATVESIDTTRMMNGLIALPDLSTQRAIANFLDRETARVDRLIEMKEAQISRLEEECQAFVSRAVTGNLSSCPKKRTGFSWEPVIPEEWVITRLKFLCDRIVDCLHDTPEHVEDGDYPSVRTSDVSRGRLSLDNVKRVSEAEYLHRIQRLEPRRGDILYTREGERHGLAALIPPDVRLCLGQRMMMFRVNGLVRSGYLMWYLNGSFAYQWLAQSIAGATSPHLNIFDIRNVPVFLPGLDEQDAIVGAIEALFQKKEKMAEKITSSIQRLCEFRSALITAAVTGQIDVTAWGKRGTTDRRLDKIEVEMAATAAPEPVEMRA